MDQSNSQLLGVLGLSGTCFPRKLLPFGNRYPYVIQCSNPTHHPKRHLDRLSRFLYGSQMLCCTMHCQWERNLQNYSFALGFRHPAIGGPSHSHRQQASKIWKRSRLRFRRYPLGQTHTHTYMLITILRNRSRGQSSK